LRRARATDGDHSGAIAANAGKDIMAIGEIVHRLRRKRRRLVAPALSQVRLQGDETVGVGSRDGMQQHRLDGTEDRSVAPVPSAMAAIAATAKPGLSRRPRMPTRKSVSKSLYMSTPA